MGNTSSRKTYRCTYCGYRDGIKDTCYRCDANERAYNEARRKAKDEADRQARAEKDRIQRVKNQLLEAERTRLKKEQEERRKLRETEQKEQAKAMRKAQEEQQARLNEMKNRFDENHKSFNSTEQKHKKSKNPAIRFKKERPKETVLAILNKVKDCAVVGEAIKEQIGLFEMELEDILQDEYKAIEPEIARYKTYSTELSGIAIEFANQFKGVLNENCNDVEDLMDEKDEKAMMDESIANLRDAIDTMEKKLAMADSYYDDILADYQQFADFCAERKMEIGAIPGQIRQIANELKNERDVFEGFEDQKQKLNFDIKFSYKKTVIVKSKGGEEGDRGKCAIAGGVIGATAGAVIGGLAGGPVGAIIGSALLGAAVGGLVGFFCGSKETAPNQLVTKETTETDTFKLDVKAVTFNGKKQREALEKLTKPFLKHVEKLKENQTSAYEQRGKLLKLQMDLKNMSKPLQQFNKTLEALESASFSKAQFKSMKKQWKALEDQIGATVDAMKKSK